MTLQIVILRKREFRSSRNLPGEILAFAGVTKG